MIKMKIKTELALYKNKIQEMPVEQRHNSYQSFLKKIEKRENNYDQMTKALDKIRGK